MNLISPRLLILLLAALATASCAADRERAQRMKRAEPVIASFAAGSADTVTIDVLDPEAAQQIELVAPDGGVLTAFRIDRERVSGRTSGDPSVGVGVGVGTGSGGGTRVGTGIGIGFPFVIGGEEERRVRSIGQVKLADMAAYRAGWTQWTARVTFPDGRKVTVAAPPPPA